MKIGTVWLWLLLEYLHVHVQKVQCMPLFPQIPEYCHRLDEQDVLDNAFDLIFAFDEIVALGYRENVNLAQIRTFTEMDSHEEKVYEAMRKVRRLGWWERGWEVGVVSEGGRKNEG